MPIKIYSTLSEKKETLEKPKDFLKLFVCGPTVYDYPHIGNAKTFLVFDIFTRYLRSQGFKVFYLQNITDIDDKIIKKSEEEKISWKKISSKYKKIYLRNMKALGITSVTKYAPATSYIKEITKQVETLVKKGSAYKIENDGYYFNLSTFPDYGKLSKRTATQAEDAISRIDEGVNKKNKGDFALWKFKKNPDEPSWKSRIGEGRPGWHIEDTAISEKYFGPQYDIHGGAVDLKFPHHEAEIAQQESASGKKPFVKIWMHSGFVTVDGKKMSKSLNNFLSVDDFLKTHDAEILRFIVASHHYRSPIDYSEKSAKQAEQSINKIKNFIGKLLLIKDKGAIKEETVSAIKKMEKEFDEAMADDFNTALAIASIFEFINKLEPQIWKLNKKEASVIKKIISEKTSILGFNFAKALKIPSEIAELAKKRELLRTNKQFANADALRKQAEDLGYIIEDTPKGQYIYKK